MNKRFELPEEFNVYGSHSIVEALKLWLKEYEVGVGEEFEIDAGKVMEIDGTGIQILAALTHSGYRWTLVEASARFIGACLTTGHQGWLSNVESVS